MTEYEALTAIGKRYDATLRAAVAHWLDMYRQGSRRLLGSSWKSEKTDKKLGTRSLVLNLSPATESPWNLCPHASEGCAAMCLRTAGRNKMDGALVARLGRTVAFMTDRDVFVHALYCELHAAALTAAKRRQPCLVRLNNLSDVAWERIAPELFAISPWLRFYDYTKDRGRYSAFRSGKGWPRNYHLTYSIDERLDSHNFGANVVAWGGSAAIVFADELPATRNGYPVIDGDEHDNRRIDPAGVYVGLRAKGSARSEAGRSSGFTV
jgi:hypothetical protein